MKLHGFDEKIMENYGF